MTKSLKQLFKRGVSLLLVLITVLSTIATVGASPSDNAFTSATTGMRILRLETSHVKNENGANFSLYYGCKPGLSDNDLPDRTKTDFADDMSADGINSHDYGTNVNDGGSRWFYCIHKGTSVHNDYTIKEGDDAVTRANEYWNDTLSEKARRGVTLALSCGFPNVVDRYFNAEGYAATQLIIWEFTNGGRTTPFQTSGWDTSNKIRDKNSGNRWFLEAYDAILATMAMRCLTPTFVVEGSSVTNASTDITTVTLKGTGHENGVTLKTGSSAYYRFGTGTSNYSSYSENSAINAINMNDWTVSENGLHVEVSGTHDLYVWADESYAGKTVSATLTRKISGLGNGGWAVKSNNQEMVTGVPNMYISFKLQAKVPLIPGTATLQKTSPTDDVAGYCFKIYNWDTNTSIYAKTNSKGNLCLSNSSYSTLGDTEFDLKDGEYTFLEVLSVKGKGRVFPDSWRFTVTNRNGVTTYDKTYTAKDMTTDANGDCRLGKIKIEGLTGGGKLTMTINNKPYYGDVILYKRDAAAKDLENDPSAKLSGAKFKISKTSYGSAVAYLVEDTSNKGTYILSSTEGTFKRSTGLPVGTYYLKETTAPTGYTPDTKTYSFEVYADKTTVVNNDGRKYFLNFKSGEIVIQKIDSSGNGNVAGNYFKIYSDDDLYEAAVNYQRYGRYSLSSTWTGTTDVKGRLIPSRLGSGRTYYLLESPRNGYALEKIVVTVRDKNGSVMDQGGESFTITADDYYSAQMDGGVSGYKRMVVSREGWDGFLKFTVPDLNEGESITIEIYNKFTGGTFEIKKQVLGAGLSAGSPEGFEFALENDYTGKTLFYAKTDSNGKAYETDSTFTRVTDIYKFSADKSDYYYLIEKVKPGYHLESVSIELTDCDEQDYGWSYDAAKCEDFYHSSYADYGACYRIPIGLLQGFNDGGNIVVTVQNEKDGGTMRIDKSVINGTGRQDEVEGFKIHLYSEEWRHEYRDEWHQDFDYYGISAKDGCVAQTDYNYNLINGEHNYEFEIHDMDDYVFCERIDESYGPGYNNYALTSVTITVRKVTGAVETFYFDADDIVVYKNTSLNATFYSTPEFAITGVNGGGSVSIHVVNTLKPSEIILHKVDSLTEKPISDCTFAVYKDVNGNGQFDVGMDIYVAQMIETPEDSGTYVLGGLYGASYLVKEMRAPAPYVPDPNYYSVKFGGYGDSVEVTTSGSHYFENTPIGSITVYKEDAETQERLKDAVFQLQYRVLIRKNTWGAWNPVRPLEDGEAVGTRGTCNSYGLTDDGTLTTDEFGTVEFTGLYVNANATIQVGTVQYQVVETRAPEGYARIYSKSTAILTVDAATSTAEFTFENGKKPTVSISKSFADGTTGSLEGFRFVLDSQGWDEDYYALTDTTGQAYETDENYTKVSNAADRVYTFEVEPTQGIYLKELATPGYQIKEIRWTISDAYGVCDSRTISNLNGTTDWSELYLQIGYSEHLEIEVLNERVSTLSMRKKLAAGTTGTLEGFRFELYSPFLDQSFYGITDSDGDAYVTDANYTKITDEDLREFTFSGLRDDGDFVFTEKACTGYHLESLEFLVDGETECYFDAEDCQRAKQANGDYVFSGVDLSGYIDDGHHLEIVAENAPDMISFKINKSLPEGMEGNLEGLRFYVWSSSYYYGISDETGKVYETDRSFVRTGDDTFEIPIPYSCNSIYVEENVPSGYRLASVVAKVNGTAVASACVDESGEVSYTYTRDVADCVEFIVDSSAEFEFFNLKDGDEVSFEIVNAPLRGSIKVKKVDAGTGEPLGGITFKLEYSTDSGTTWLPIQHFTENSSVGTTSSLVSSSGELMTGTDGIALFDALWVGDGILYRVTETATLDNYVLLTEPAFEGKLTLQQHEDGSKDYDLVFTVVNSSVNLPPTGSHGLYLIVTIGTVLMGLCAIVYILRKKQKMTI